MTAEQRRKSTINQPSCLTRMLLAPFSLLAFPFFYEFLVLFGPLLGFDGAFPFFLGMLLSFFDDVVYFPYRDALGRNLLDDVLVRARFTMQREKFKVIIGFAPEVAAEPFLAARIDTVKLVAAFLVVELGSLVFYNFYTHQILNLSKNHLLNRDSGFLKSSPSRQVGPRNLYMLQISQHSSSPISSGTTATAMNSTVASHAIPYRITNAIDRKEMQHPHKYRRKNIQKCLFMQPNIAKTITRVNLFAILDDMFKAIKKIFKERIDCVKYTWAHYKALNELALYKGFYFPFHDIDKIIMYPILGKKFTHKIHRAWSGHHYRNGDIKNKFEAALDWECARRTKPDKPLDAYDTWKKYYPDVDMTETLQWLRLYHGDEGYENPYELHD